MFKQRLHHAIDDWLADADKIPIYQLQIFVEGFCQDYDAIHASLFLPWSNGQTEGQVNRLKFIKRQMYGRAKSDLLRLRVLAPSFTQNDAVGQYCKLHKGKQGLSIFDGHIAHFSPLICAKCGIRQQHHNVDEPQSRGRSIPCLESR